MQLGQVISNPDLEGDYSPIYTTEKKRVRTRKKVGTDQIFFPCKPSVLCFPKWIRTRFFWFWGYGRLWPQNRKKKTSPDPFCCSKALCKRIFVPYHLLYVSLS